MTNPWRVVDRPGVNLGTAGEQIARAALIQIKQNLDEQCTITENLWGPRDQDWASAMSIPYKPTKISRPDHRTGYYVGAQPSLVESRFDKWPAITSRIGPRNPSQDSEQPDQFDSMDLSLIIEVLTVAGPFKMDPIDDREASDAVDRQYQRLADSVISCFALDKTLGNNIFPFKRPPRWNPSLPFTRKVEKGSGGWLTFQGVELTYVVTSLLY